MGRTSAEVEVPVLVSAAEALWYDLARWPVFVDGFGHVVKADPSWPRAGARVVWDSIPAGRGRVVERVASYEARRGQTVEVEDAQITGTQVVTFTAAGESTSRVRLELEWRMKQRTPFTPLVDALFVRRAFSDALRRTLARVRNELRAETELPEIGR